MTTLADQMRKYIDIIEDVVSKKSNALRYCYIDISTSTSEGMSAIRIFPKEGRNKFFSDVVGDVKDKLRDINEIINQAKSENGKIRIIITREGDFDKQLSKYIPSEKNNSEIVDDILKQAKKLADQIQL